MLVNVRPNNKLIMIKEPAVGADGCIVCPACKERIKCSPRGWKNLKKTHLGKKVCVDMKQKQDKNKGLRNRSLMSMFGHFTSKPTPIPSTTHAPASLPNIPVGILDLPVQTVAEIADDSADVVIVDVPATADDPANTALVDVPVEPANLVDLLKILAKCLCDDIHHCALVVLKPDPLACFDVDPAGYDNKTLAPEDL